MNCIECRADPGARGLRRERCCRCYTRLVRSLKKAGAFTAVDRVRPITERLFEKAVAAQGGCLLWTATTGSDGYAKFRIGDTNRGAHRVAYELIIGAVPAGHQLDHLCHTRDTSCAGGPTCSHRRCINPHHLEPVAPRENGRRSANAPSTINAAKTHCPQGHPYDETNTWRSKAGKRHCRTCLDDHQRRYRAAAAAARGL